MNIHTFVVLAYKKSSKLESCIKSVLNQSIKTNVVIATSTPNQYIENIAKKYKLKMLINKETNGIGNDFDFASNCMDTKLITIAHQDDIYNFDYAKEVIEKYKKFPDALIIFTDYYEIKNNKEEKSNINLKIKRILLFPLRFHRLSGLKIIKRSALRFGNSICCPAVTFVKKNVPKEKFTCKFKCDVDWYAWEKISKNKGKYIYIPKKLMGHRIHEDSTTTKIIENNIRTEEDLEMFKKFWPTWFAKKINRLYAKSENNNQVKQ